MNIFDNKWVIELVLMNFFEFELLTESDEITCVGPNGFIFNRWERLGLKLMEYNIHHIGCLEMFWIVLMKVEKGYVVDETEKKIFSTSYVA